MNLLDTALQYHRAGVRVVPVKEDKRPAVPSWKQYQHAQTEADIHAIFAADHYGIAILTGINGLEVIDIDTKYDLTGKLAVDFYKAADKLNNNDPAITSLCMQQTRSGGYHLLYRCPVPDGNKKLARRPAAENEDANTTPVLIETRGVGGYIVAYPTPGYKMQFGSFLNIPEVTQATRDAIHTAAKSFDELPEMEAVYAPKAAYTLPPGQSVTPWDDFNDRESPVDLLQRYGWTFVYRQGEKVFLKRPGKSDAKTSGNYHEGRKLFVCHTTSTPLPAEKGLTAWSIYKYYQHAGDASAAARQLYADGYGTRYEKDAPAAPSPYQQPVTPEQAKEQENEFMKQVWATRYTYGPVQTEQAIFTHSNWSQNGKTFNIGGMGMLGAISGRKKSGKTFVMLHIVASAIAGGVKKLGFSVRLPAGKNILFVDTEQSRFFFELTQHDMYDLAGVKTPEHYFAFHLRKWSVSERLTALKRLIDEIPNLGMIVIDGIVDLCPDMMDYDKSSKTVQELMTICEQTGALVLTVLHLTKQGAEMRGHLGTELGNKCDFSITVEKDAAENWFAVKSVDSRFSPFPSFQFIRDSDTGKAIYDETNDTQPQPITGISPAMVAASVGNPEYDIPF